jgi:hypothetical protein
MKRLTILAITAIAMTAACGGPAVDRGAIGPSDGGLQIVPRPPDCQSNSVLRPPIAPPPGYPCVTAP